MFQCFLCVFQLLPVLEESVINPKWNYCVVPLYRQIVLMMHAWCKECNSEEDRNYEDLVSFFINNVFELFHKLVVAYDNKSEWILKNQIEFVVCLKDPSVVDKKQDRRVTFRLDSEDTNISCKETEDPVIVSASDLTGISCVKEFVHSVCALYLSEALKANSPTVINHLTKLLVTLDSQELYIHLASTSTPDSTVLSFYDKVIHPWIQNENVVPELVVQLVFLLLTSLEHEEKQYILRTVSQVCIIL